MTEREEAEPRRQASQATVTVKLFGGLDQRAARAGAGAAAGQVMLDPRDARTVKEVIAGVGLQSGEAGLVLVNGLHAKDDTLVGPGDTVALFPHVSGG